MRRSGLEYSLSNSTRKSLDDTRDAIDRIHTDLSHTWSDHIDDNPFDAKLKIESRLRRLESAYLETRLALRNALDDESQVLLFVLGAKIMHDIAEQSERHDLTAAIESPVPESGLREASLAWLRRGIVIASVQDEPSAESDVSKHGVSWQSPVGSKQHQLEEARYLAAQYSQELAATKTPETEPVDEVTLAA